MQKNSQDLLWFAAVVCSPLGRSEEDMVYWVLRFFSLQSYCRKIRETGNWFNVRFIFNSCICSLNNKIFADKCPQCLFNYYGWDNYKMQVSHGELELLLYVLFKTSFCSNNSIQKVCINVDSADDLLFKIMNIG